MFKVDEETDLDLIAALADKRAPFGMAIVNTEVTGNCSSTLLIYLG